MLSALHIGISGLSAQALRLGVSAHNVANLNTDGFQGQRVTLQSQDGGGVSGRIETVDQPGPVILDGTGGTRQLSNVSLEEEIVTQITAEAGFRANARVIGTASEMMGTLLDIHI